MRIIYWSEIEYKYTSEHEDSKRLIGGMVYVFCRGIGVRDVLDKITLSFSEKKLKITKILYVSPYNSETEWEDKEDQMRYSEILAETLGTDDVIFDDFYSYEQE